MLILLWGIISEKWKYSISSHVLLLRFFFYFLWVCLCRRCMYMGCVCMWTEEDGHQTVLMWCSPPYNFEAESLTEPGAHSFRLIWKLQAACSSPPACSCHYWSCRLHGTMLGLLPACWGWNSGTAACAAGTLSCRAISATIIVDIWDGILSTR